MIHAAIKIPDTYRPMLAGIASRWNEHQRVTVTVEEVATQLAANALFHMLDNGYTPDGEPLAGQFKFIPTPPTRGGRT